VSFENLNKICQIGFILFWCKEYPLQCVLLQSGQMVQVPSCMSISVLRNNKRAGIFIQEIMFKLLWCVLNYFQSLTC